MLSVLTKAGRQLMLDAQDEARRLRHSYIGSEHVLLALFRHEGCRRALERLGVTVEEARVHVVRIVGQGSLDDYKYKNAAIPFTPRTKKVMGRALREALRLSQSPRPPEYVEPEHVLLGLVCEDMGVAARILLDYDHEYADKIRNELTNQLGGTLVKSAPEPSDSELVMATAEMFFAAVKALGPENEFSDEELMKLLEGLGEATLKFAEARRRL